MDVYTTEEQQIEAIKKWWKTNGNSVLIGIALAITAVLGWQTWNQNKEANQEAAAMMYGQLVEAAAGVQQKRLANDADALGEQVATFNHIGEELKTNFAGSEYAVFAALTMAKEFMFADEKEKAIEQLTWAKDNTQNQGIQLIANLRLARVLADQQQFDKALAQLDSVVPGVQADAYEEVRGDIYLAQGEAEKARAAYKKAMDLSATQNKGQSRPILKIKHDNLLVAGS